RREMGLRIALGATRSRLVAQLLTESVLLAIAGGAIGIALAWWGIKATAATVPIEVQQYIPGFGAIVLDYHALIVATVASTLAGIAFGLVPALIGSTVDVSATLKETGRFEMRRSPLRVLRSGLVVGEIALALMLVFGAALMAATFGRVSRSDPGFRTADVLTGTITLPDAGYPDDSATTRFWDRLHEYLVSEPGVAAAEFTTVLPMSFNEESARLYVEGQRPARLEDARSAGVRRVSSGYLSAVGIPRLRGRSFTDADRSGSPPVVVLSETAARLLLQGDPVGQRLVLSDRVVTVVGVVRDTRANPLMTDSPTSVVYAPIAQWPTRTASAVLRVSSGEPTTLSATLQQVIARQDARLAAGDVLSMRRVVDVVVSPQAGTAQILLASALIALIMAAVGTYGVMAYTVARRTQEIGVRVAIGATAGMIVRLVLGGAARLAAMGVLIGIVGAFALGRSMQAILVDTNPTDPVILGGAAALLGGIGLLAGWLPARRATRVNPITALRAE
ncbi:MAG: ABC transporter permease, partial [Gemmatimonadetes bacterium]|nr:ABC transporter permease [Gemmatimonadota bacterium]